jgi:hypothetical protein
MAFHYQLPAAKQQQRSEEKENQKQDQPTYKEKKKETILKKGNGVCILIVPSCSLLI